jgi:N-acyl-phosphatidylethanolamine-hydrolysing phospholipase D
MMRRRFLAFLAAVTALLGLTRLLRLVPAAALASQPGAASLRHPLPPHHDPDGGFRNPWPTAHTRESGGFLRWRRERRQQRLPPDPQPGTIPLVQPQHVRPRAAHDELRITWVGHATFLIQFAGLNILTDPHWSERASPVQFAGPQRFVPPGIDWADLPPIDGVLLSHDHYDHLDDGTVRRLHRRLGDGLRWFTPLGYADWLRARGVRSCAELDWWEESLLPGEAGPVRVVALPCQHWTRRTFWDGYRRLWASWALIDARGSAVYFGGDSGYFPEYPRIRERIGAFTAVILPVGAYEPRWFMQPVHMNPEEAVQTYRDLGATGTLLPMHWGTWRLTDEDPLEPPVRTAAAWTAAGLPPERLRMLRHGETWIYPGDDVRDHRGSPA